MATRKRMSNKFTSGDFVRHDAIEDAIGILIQEIKLSFETSNFKYWEVFWTSHPTEQGTITILSNRWFKPFNGYRKMKKKIDKEGTS